MSQEISHPTKTGIDEDQVKDAIDQTFGLMKVSYQFFMHNKSASEISDTKKMWFYHLNAFTPEQILAAAGKMIDHYPDGAPELGQFKKVINQARPEEKMEPSRRIEYNGNNEIANKALDAMTKLMNTKRFVPGKEVKK